MTGEPYAATRTGGYERRIGRYGRSLAEAFVAAVDVRPRWRVLDVGCGTGALTAALARRTAPEQVTAVDPAKADLAACAERAPGIETVAASAERLPFADATFDAVLSQLVLGHLADGPAAAAEMTRVTRPGGTVAACVWDFAAGMTVLRAFWDAAHEVDAGRAARFDQAATHAYGSPGEMEALWRGAGLTGVTSGSLRASAEYADFADLWEPMLLADGAPGRFLEGLGAGARDRVRAGLARRLGPPAGPFVLRARAWFVLGRRRAG